ncbi:hypothetical protein [Paraburkholderia sp. RL17-337-BIB-A]|uniref:hypothetical protein n=1 Tax=Paraburkholderia sp. RL17-337-BIB-A TaxID=3031636 RepID=UPI0038BCA16B
MSRLSQEGLERLRNLAAAQVVCACATHAKRDFTFEPTTATETERWHVNVDGREFELLLRGPKFYDTRAKRGGGGGIDLVMHLYRLNFKEAVALLQTAGFD